MNEIVTKARQVDELAGQVAAASGQQTQGITQINSAVAQMDQVTQSNAASADECAAAAEQLKAHSGTVNSSVNDLVRLVGRANQSQSNPKASNAPRERNVLARTQNQPQPANV